MSTVCFDFDRVLHLYLAPFTTAEEIADGPVPGAAEAVRRVLELDYDAVVFTTRARTEQGTEAVRTWMARHGFPDIPVTALKPPAIVYVDDRAYRFEGDFAHLLELLEPENRKELDPWHPEHPSEHVDDWLDRSLAALTASTDELAARWMIEFYRLPAWKKSAYERFMRDGQNRPRRISCSYDGKRWYLSGASRMGDIFLRKTPPQDVIGPYDLRVPPRACSDWKQEN